MRQFFLACEGWDEGESLPRSLLNLTVRHLVEDCHIQTMLSCPEAAFLGTQVRAPGGRAAPGTRTPRPAAAGPQPTVNMAIPPLCQKAVGTFNRLYPELTITDLCQQGRVKFFASAVWLRRSVHELRTSRAMRRVPLPTRGVHGDRKSPGFYCQGHGKRHGNHEGHRIHLTGDPGRHARRPGSVTPSTSSP